MTVNIRQTIANTIEITRNNLSLIKIEFSLLVYCDSGSKIELVYSIYFD